jgi:predicted  nucleic acid-binding Zn-ribbon protein
LHVLLLDRVVELESVLDDVQQQKEKAEAEAVKLQEACDSLERRCTDVETKFNEAVEDKATMESQLKILEQSSTAHQSNTRSTGSEDGMSGLVHDSSTLQVLKGEFYAGKDRNADYEEALQQWEGMLFRHCGCYLM